MLPGGGAELQRVATAAHGDSGRAASAVVRLRFLGANPEPLLEGLEPQPGRANFFLGRDRARWLTDVPMYGGVVYRSVYRGIDLVYRGEQGRLKGEFHIAPGADPRQLRLAYTGAAQPRLSDAGALVIETSAGVFTEEPPVVYQENTEQARTPVSGRFVLRRDHSVAVAVGSYDSARPLIIDPTLVFSTYLGGSGTETGNGIAVDGAGDVYLVGNTTSTDFPGAGGIQATFAGGAKDAFVTKLTKDGRGIIYSTYLGGTGDDFGLAIAVDASGNAYVSGSTTSTDFPTANAIQSTNGGGNDAFIAEVGPAGDQLVYSTYLGGSDFDTASGLAVDSAGAAYVGGTTQSADFPTANPFQGSFGGGLEDVFVAKIGPGGSPLVYSTYFGGSGSDDGAGVAGIGYASSGGSTMSCSPALR